MLEKSDRKWKFETLLWYAEDCQEKDRVDNGWVKSKMCIEYIELKFNEIERNWNDLERLSSNSSWRKLFYNFFR